MMQSTRPSPFSMLTFAFAFSWSCLCLSSGEAFSFENGSCRDRAFWGDFVQILGGNYTIGSPKGESDRKDNERQHVVMLSSFEIMATMVTQAQYARCMHNNPSLHTGDDHPVDRVSWHNAKAYAKALSVLDPVYNYDLPSEAQLEVAYRGGNNTPYVSSSQDKHSSKWKNYVKGSSRW